MNCQRFRLKSLLKQKAKQKQKLCKGEIHRHVFSLTTLPKMPQGMDGFRNILHIFVVRHVLKLVRVLSVPLMLMHGQ